MARHRLIESDIAAVADELDVSASEVRRAVLAFFGSILSSARAYPFDSERRIYTKDGFEEFSDVWNIPSIGRIGPVYSRYLKWRKNESKALHQVPRSSFRPSGLTQDDIEHIAEDVLSGRTPTPVRRKKNSELFNRVWIVGKDGKKSARQVLPKVQKKNVQD